MIIDSIIIIDYRKSIPKAKFNASNQRELKSPDRDVSVGPSTRRIHGCFGTKLESFSIHLFVDCILQSIHHAWINLFLHFISRTDFQ